MTHDYDELVKADRERLPHLPPPWVEERDVLRTSQAIAAEREAGGNPAPSSASAGQQ